MDPGLVLGACIRKNIKDLTKTDTHLPVDNQGCRSTLSSCPRIQSAPSV